MAKLAIKLVSNYVQLIAATADEGIRTAGCFFLIVSTDLSSNGILISVVPVPNPTPAPKKAPPKQRVFLLSHPQLKVVPARCVAKNADITINSIGMAKLKLIATLRISLNRGHTSLCRVSSGGYTA